MMRTARLIHFINHYHDPGIEVAVSADEERGKPKKIVLYKIEGTWNPNVMIGLGCLESLTVV